MTPKSINVVATPVTQVTAPVTPTKTSKNPLRVFTTQVDPDPILPSYYSPSAAADHPSPAAKTPSSRYSRATACTKKKVFGVFGREQNRESLAPPLPLNISGPLNTNPQFAHLVQRPDSALHPSRNAESEAFRWKA